MPTKIKTLLSVIVAATVTAFAPVHAAPLPLDIFHEVNGDDLGSYRLVNINIPTENTTQPVYGGAVRYYDVAIAQAIARRHGGKITVTSQVDVGSCFQVRLPACNYSDNKPPRQIGSGE